MVAAAPPDHYFVDAVKIGVTKVNINTDMRIAYRKALEAALASNPNEFAIVKLMDQVIAAVRAVVESKIDTFNSTGKARPQFAFNPNSCNNET